MTSTASWGCFVVDVEVIWDGPGVVLEGLRDFGVVLGPSEATLSSAEEFAAAVYMCL